MVNPVDGCAHIKIKLWFFDWGTITATSLTQFLHPFHGFVKRIRTSPLSSAKESFFYPLFLLVRLTNALFTEMIARYIPNHTVDLLSLFPQRCELASIDYPTALIGSSTTETYPKHSFCTSVIFRISHSWRNRYTPTRTGPALGHCCTLSYPLSHNSKGPLSSFSILSRSVWPKNRYRILALCYIEPSWSCPLSSSDRVARGVASTKSIVLFRSTLS